MTPEEITTLVQVAKRSLRNCGLVLLMCLFFFVVFARKGHNF